MFIMCAKVKIKKPKTDPTKRSLLVNVGSTFNPTPIKPPGIAYNNSFCSFEN